MTNVHDLGEKIVFDLGGGDEAVSTTGEAITILGRLKANTQTGRILIQRWPP